MSVCEVCTKPSKMFRIWIIIIDRSISYTTHTHTHTVFSSNINQNTIYMSVSLINEIIAMIIMFNSEKLCILLFFFCSDTNIYLRIMRLNSI